MVANGFSSMQWTSGVGTLYVDGNELPDGGPAIVLMGLSKTRLGGIPLPFLMPGSLIAPSGPCAVYSSSEFAFGAVSSATTARLTMPVPAAPSLHAVHLYAQYLAIDPAAGNLFGVALSNAVEFCFVAPYQNAPIGQVWATNVFAATGTAVSNYGYVVELR
jgi:hypothetical protein